MCQAIPNCRINNAPISLRHGLQVRLVRGLPRLRAALLPRDEGPCVQRAVQAPEPRALTPRERRRVESEAWVTFSV